MEVLNRIKTCLFALVVLVVSAPVAFSQAFHKLEVELDSLLPPPPYGMLKDPILIEKAQTAYDSFVFTQYYFRVDGSEMIEMILQDFRWNKSYYTQAENSSFDEGNEEGTIFRKSGTYKGLPAHRTRNQGEVTMGVFLGESLLIEMRHTVPDTTFTSIHKLLDQIDLDALKGKLIEFR